MSHVVDNNSMKQIKNLFSEMFGDHKKKNTCELYEVISDIISKNSKGLNKRLDRLLVEIKGSSDILKHLTDKTKDNEKSLVVNQIFLKT